MRYLSGFFSENEILGHPSRARAICARLICKIAHPKIEKTRTGSIRRHFVGGVLGLGGLQSLPYTRLGGVTAKWSASRSDQICGLDRHVQCLSYGRRTL